MTQASSRAVVTPARPAPEAQPSWLRVVAPSSRARKAPFRILLAVVVSAGVLGLTFLSVAVNQQAFTLAELERSNRDLTVQHSTLRAEVNRLRAPDRVERVASKRGLVPVERARIVAWPGQAGSPASPQPGQAGPADAGRPGQATTPSPAAAEGRLWTVDDPYPLKHYLAQP